MANLDELFERWLEGKTITEAELSLLHENEHYATMMHEASAWKGYANTYSNEPVPEWDRFSTFIDTKTTQQRWWRPAIAASIGAIALLSTVVLWQQNLQLKEQLNAQHQLGIQNQQQLENLVKQLHGMQREQNAQLLDAVQHVLTTSRDERREDIGVVLEYWKTQRAQDNALFRIQLNDLAEQVEYLPQSRVAKLEEH